MFLLCCGGLGLLISRVGSSATPVMPIEIALRAALPPREFFPPLGNPEQQFPSGVNSYFVFKRNNHRSRAEHADASICSAR